MGQDGGSRRGGARPGRGGKRTSQVRMDLSGPRLPAKIAQEIGLPRAANEPSKKLHQGRKLPDAKKHGQVRGPMPQSLHNTRACV